VSGAEAAARIGRLSRVRAAMGAAGVDALLLSLGADLPWLTGYVAMPLERLTMLVLPADEPATLVVPELEAPRVEEHPEAFALRPWAEGDDPVAVVAGLVGGRRRLAIGDRTWATFLVGLQEALPERDWAVASRVTGPIRAVKDSAEIEALAAASAANDRVALQLLGGEIPLIGRTEAEVSADIGRRIIAEGHQRSNFAIVGSGPNSASPHHEAGGRRIGPDEAVVCDFGGTMNGYCSDMTRTVFTGEPDSRQRELYESTRRPARSSRPAVTAPPSSIGPATGSVSRSTRIPTSWPATPLRSSRATPFPSSRASTWRAATAPGSRTSSWPPTRDHGP
jgi:Xaa-Pro aminopeptidase